MGRRQFVIWLVAGMMMAVATPAQGAEQERSWQIILSGFFKGGAKPLYLYARERDGEWVAVVGSSRDPDRPGGKTYNRSWYCGDLSGVPIQDGKVKGQFILHVTPDLWVPANHRDFQVVFDIDATLNGSDKLEGSYKVVSIGTKDETTRDFGKAGRVSGSAELKTQAALPDPVTFRCNMQGSLVGGDPKYGGRCMVLWLGLENGKLTSTIHGLLSQKFEVYGKEGFTAAGNTATADADRLTAHITVPTKTLDMEPCQYIFDLDGRRLNQVIVGTYKLTVRIDGKADVAIIGSFDGGWSEGVTHLKADAAAETPYDTKSRYPHVSVCALVNWPIGEKERSPADVLPRCYRDSSCGFYVWRNRWQDGNDTVITVPTNRTEGYMSAKPDRALSLNTMGRHVRWGTVKDGPTKHWSTSPRGETSSLTLSDGTCFAVDFSGASGADVMLVTTGKAEGQTVKIGGKTLTFYFPTQKAAPQVKAQGDAAVVGKQRVVVRDGNLVLSVKGK